MAGHDIVVIGASTGGVEVLTRLVRALPPALPATLFVVSHFPPGGHSLLPELLSRAGPLLATHAQHGEPFHPGHIYVAPPDYHLLLAAGKRLFLSHGPRENHHRPAVDPLFRSAARHYGARVIGVVLTGGLGDGAAGLMAVRAAGGIAVVQDPDEALAAAMPLNATRIAGADHVVPSDRLAPLLVELIQRPIAGPGDLAMTDPLDKLPETVQTDMDEQVHDGRRGRVSVFSCPECGGALWQVNEAELLRFRCHVGHVYNGDVIFADQAEALEAALWTAVRIFKERYLLAHQLAAREVARGDQVAAARFQEQADQAARYSELIQRYVLNGDPPSAPEKPGPAPGEEGRAS